MSMRRQYPATMRSGLLPAMMILLGVAASVGAAVPAKGLRGEPQTITAEAAPQLKLFGDADWNDYTVRAMVRMKDPARGAEAGMVLQARDNANYLVLSLVSRPGGPYAVLRI